MAPWSPLGATLMGKVVAVSMGPKNCLEGPRCSKLNYVKDLLILLQVYLSKLYI